MILVEMTEKTLFLEQFLFFFLFFLPYIYTVVCGDRFFDIMPYFEHNVSSMLPLCPQLTLFSLSAYPVLL